MTNQLPPAPEGFAWMPCNEFPCRTVVGKGDAAAIRSLTSGYWEHCAGPWETVTPDVCRLMRRLGPTEKPWGGCRGFRVETGGWFIRNSLSESWPQLTWYAPVRLVPNHVPDFGKEGLRYLDEGEPSTADAYHYGMSGRVVPFTLPPLPILDQMCAEKPGLRGGIDEEAQRLVDDEANRYISELKVESMTERGDEIDALRAQLAELRTQAEAAAHYASMDLSMLIPGGPTRDELRAQLAEVTAERDEAVNWMEGVLGQSLQRTEDWYHSQNRKIEALKAEVGKVTAERDALDDAAITALSGEVCTPVEGYAKAGANWLKRDIGELVAQRDGLTRAIKMITRRARKLVDSGALSRAQETALLNPDPSAGD